MADSAKHPRSTKPGRKRLLITVTTLLSFIFGTPFWYKSTQVYRAALPFKDIDSYSSWASSNSLQLRCHLQVIFASGTGIPFNEAKLDSIPAGIRRHIHNLIEGHSLYKQSCQAGFELLVTLDAPNLCLRSGQEQGITAWSCGLGNPNFLKTLLLSDDDAVDESLWKFSNKDIDSPASDATYDGGLYTIVVLEEENAGGSESCGTSDGEETNMCTTSDGEETNMCTTKDDHLRTVVGKYRHAWISAEFTSSAVEDELIPKIGDVAVNFFGSSKIAIEDKERCMPLSADGEAILSVSLLNAEPSHWIFDWNFQDLEESFILPVVEALKGIARLKVESQVLYYTPKAVQSQWIPSLNAHVVTAQQLPFFVNANEWHLESSSAAAGRSKILHFAIYVPAANEWPLQFQSTDGQLSSTNTFTSPGWGGVSVWNPGQKTAPVFTSGKPTVSRLSSKDFKPLAGVLVAQLRTLFCLSPTIVEDNKTHVFSIPAYRTGFADWELDVLLRRRAIDDVAAVATTLTSLSRMVRKLPNMLIMDEIGDQIKASLTAAASARASAAQGNYLAAAEAARTAKSLAEAAFLQPSIMSLLYNPTEHHLAIYTPFFVPVLLHAVVAVVKEVSRHRREWKRFKQKVP